MRCEHVINVLIAEDELLVRMGILSMINWENMGMKVVACVGDGLAALDDAMRYRPELIITDIVMPGLDGISMLRKVREQGLNPLSIVITALHQSSAAEHMAELNIVACLVKATMTQCDIVSALMLARSRLPEGGGVENETAPAEDMSAAYAALLRGEAAPVGSMPTAQAYILCRVRASDSLSGVLSQSLAQLTIEPLRNYGLMCMAAHDRHILLAFRSPLFSARDAVTQALMELRRYVERNLLLRPDFAIMGSVPKCADASGCIDMLRRFIDECEPGVNWYEPTEPQTLPEERVHDSIESCLSALWALRAPERIYGAWRGLEELGDAGCALEQIKAISRIEAAMELSGEGQPVERLDALSGTLTGRAKELAARGDMGAVVRFMLSDMSREVKLSDAARLAGFHDVYLSALFKQQMGMGFTRFSSALRIEHAKRLLREDGLSTADTAELCGYHDTPYFCRVFKSVAGVTPSVWRNSR